MQVSELSIVNFGRVRHPITEHTTISAIRIRRVEAEWW